MKNILILAFIFLLSSCSKFIQGEGTVELENGKGDKVEVEYNISVSNLPKEKFYGLMKAVKEKCMSHCTNPATYVPKKVKITDGFKEGFFSVYVYYLASNAYGVEGNLFDTYEYSMDRNEIKWNGFTLDSWPE